MNTIDEILQELEALDPAFAEDRANTRALLAELLQKRPDVTVDQQFASRLRRKLLASQPKPSFTLMSMSFKKLVPTFAVVGVLVLFVVVAARLPASTLRETDGGMHITMLGAQEFGSLSGANTAASPESARSYMAGGLGGGGIAMNSVAPASEPAVDSKMMVIDPVNYPVYQYIYKGTMPELTETSMPVYRRVKGFSVPGAVTNVLKNVSGGLIDLGKLSGASLQSFVLSENRDYGYSVSVDAVEGMISMYQNYLRWPTLYDSTPMTESDMPADDAIISISDKFLADYGINKDGYGAPIVQNYWSNQPMPVDISTRSSIYYPQSVSVIYPMMVAGEETLDEGGNPQGLSVNVNVRQNKVESIWNLTNKEYEASSYEVTTDPNEILTVLKKGGVYGYVPEGSQNITDVEVGEPTRILMRSYMTNDAGVGSEVFVPALRFPVLSKPAEGYVPDVITVPLVKELLTQNTNVGTPEIMLK